jgi:hypothetical protein
VNIHAIDRVFGGLMVRYSPGQDAARTGPGGLAGSPDDLTVNQDCFDSR